MKTENNISAILANLEIESLNEMQQETQSTIADQQNTILLSPTGSGKTLAYLLPILGLLTTEVNAVQCLVIVPARELALQIEQVWKKMKTGFKANVCYGGHSIDTELKNLSNPPALLIATPGRLVDHMERGSFDTNFIKTLVLDEFDKSLQLGFQEEMSSIVNRLPNLTRKVLLSATSDIEIPEFINLKNPVTLNFTKDQENISLSYKLVMSPEKDKVGTLFQLLCCLNSEPALIFCNHREVVERISGILNKKGILTGYYHGGMDQEDRERILTQFRNGSLNYLVTTDLAARGLDIPEMKHVIHYHLPNKEDEFIHRNGRTARMQASGTAYIIKHKEENTPEYLTNISTDILKISADKPLPRRPDFQTIYISGGKKNKLSKGDIVGFFIQTGKLDKNDLGLIEVKDFISFIAIRSKSVKALLDNIKDQKMKGKKYKIEIAYNRQN